VSRISIRRGHKLTRAAAVALASSIAIILKADYGITSHWDGSTLSFRRTGLRGTLQIAPQRVLVEIELGLLLSAFREPISTEISMRLDRELCAQPRRKNKAAKRTAK
jgi:putative polyhydroxyalkanoate system protein